MNTTPETSSPTDWMWRADGLASDLQNKGALGSETVAEAIRAVPRHLFIPGHHQAGQRITVDHEQPPTPELLDLANSDRGIMTHTPADPAGGYSSTSQPSIVARQLGYLDLAPGTRVLEIGAGTGWNAALMAHITGTRVDSIEYSPVVAEEARAALKRAGGTAELVHVITGDGYEGNPGHEYDVITVTVGIAGIALPWVYQLAGGGQILAPIAHGGVHPLTRITQTPSGPVGQLVTMADYMTAAGTLYQGATPPPSTPFPTPSRENARIGAVPDLEERTGYVDLWMWLAGHDSRTTGAAAEGTSEFSGCALVEENRAVYVRPGAIHLSDDDPRTHALADRAEDLVTSWDDAGRPGITSWSAPCGSPEHRRGPPCALSPGAAPEQPTSKNGGAPAPAQGAGRRSEALTETCGWSWSPAFWPLMEDAEQHEAFLHPFTGAATRAARD